MITKKKVGRLTKFGRTIHPKNGIITQSNSFNGLKTWLKVA